MLVLPYLYQLLSTANFHLWLLPDLSQTSSLVWAGTGVLSARHCRCGSASPAQVTLGLSAACPSEGLSVCCGSLLQGWDVMGALTTFPLRSQRGCLSELCAQHRGSPAAHGAGMQWECSPPSPCAGHGCPRVAPQLRACSSDGTAQPTGIGMTF